MPSARFQAETAFVPGDKPYRMAPFRTTRIPGSERSQLIVNEAGEHHFLSDDDFRRFTANALDRRESLYQDLRAKHFLLDEYADVFQPLAFAQFRSRKRFVFEGPSLHLFIVTLRCDHSCGYCQVSRRSADAHAYDMSSETAAHAIDRLFESPSRDLKVEFQGGESALAFDRIRWIVERVEERNLGGERAIQFVIATTLVNMTADQFAYCRDHKIHLSTSLDGPELLHNRNRPRPGRDSFQRTVEGIRAAREIVGADSVSALLTVTRESLAQPEAIIDTYAALGFPSVFIRPLSYHGFARRTGPRLGYTTQEFLAFYERALAHLVKLNLAGQYLEESYITLLLEHVLTPFATGYVDLRSPTGAGFGTLVYNYDGYVYPSDEARMLVETGDATFRLGHVGDSYASLMGSPVMRELAAHGVAEQLPGCRDCAFVPFCGADPVNHWAHHGTMSGPQPEEGFCRRQTHLFSYLFRLLRDGPDDAIRVLLAWLTRRSAADIPARSAAEAA